MKPNFNKLISSAAIVFAIVESAWAQQKMLPPPPFEQGYELSKEKYPAAINAPASITVQTSWDFFLSGSFLYWRANQDAMEIAATAVNLDGVYSGAAGSVVKQHSSYNRASNSVWESIFISMTGSVSSNIRGFIKVLRTNLAARKIPGQGRLYGSPPLGMDLTPILIPPRSPTRRTFIRNGSPISMWWMPMSAVPIIKAAS